jgi:citrate lyase beta subunit
VVNLKDIASGDPRLVALMFGAEDLAGSLGAIRTVQGHEVAYGRGAVVLHAAAYDLQAIDTPYVELQNLDGLRADTERAVQMGYTGKMAIHPTQVEVITSVLDPSDEEVAHAQAMIAAHAEHREKRAGVFVFEGRMVDMPMIRAAQRVLARTQATGKGPE